MWHGGTPCCRKGQKLKLYSVGMGINIGNLRLFLRLNILKIQSIVMEKEIEKNEI